MASLSAHEAKSSPPSLLTASEQWQDLSRSPYSQERFLQKGGDDIKVAFKSLETAL